MRRIKRLESFTEAAESKPLQRSLGAWQLTLFGVGSTIGTGIFVLTSSAAQQAGPAMTVAFVIAAIVCGLASLCYAELAAMAPTSGAAYAYAYMSFGEVLAWTVGWALVLEYAITGSAVAVGWSGYLVGLLRDSALHFSLPLWLANGPFAGGLINLPAVVVSSGATLLLMRGTKESAKLNAVLVTLKLVALGLFILLTLRASHTANFHPFAPLGLASVGTASASIFFTFVGFDAVATAAEETKRPQRNVPLGLFGALSVVTAVYVLVALGVTGSYGAQPLLLSSGHAFLPGSAALGDQCRTLINTSQQLPLVCSQEPLAFVLRQIGHSFFGGLIGLTAFLALPSVILMMIYGQTRIFYVMSRDGLLPETFSRVHPRWKTPHIVTLATGAAMTLAAAFFPVGRLAAIANSGTLFAFCVVSLGVLQLRWKRPDFVRPFRVPAVWFVAPASALGCIVLYLLLTKEAKLVLPAWSAIGLLIYLSYGRRKSRFTASASSNVPDTVVTHHDG